MPYDPEQLPEKDKAQPTCSPGDDNELYILIAQCGSMTVEMQPIDALSFMAAVIKSFRNHFAHEEQILYHSKYRSTLEVYTKALSPVEGLLAREPQRYI